MPIGVRLTGGTLAALAALHGAWGAGSAFPFRRRQDLAEAVVGSSAVPPPAACFAVAAALAAAAALVLDAPRLPGVLRRPGLLGVAGILGVRGVVGLTGRTALLAPGSDSARFVRLDRRVYAPLCLALSAGSLLAWRGAVR